jgi:hypothetical protein
VALTQDGVDEFLASAKRVAAKTPGGAQRDISWRPTGPAVVWEAAVEVDRAILAASIWLWVSTTVPRSWLFKLRFGREEVFQWHVRPGPPKHRNPRNCPGERGFPGKVRTREHEHWWIENLDLKCAKELKNLTGLTHEITLARFCERMRIDFGPRYFDPVSGEQLSL